MAEEIGTTIANWFNADNVANDSLYAPLSQEGNVCGVGANLILIHDPPLHIPSDHYTYINVIDSVEPNSPAAKAGMQARDVILEVNGTKLDHKQQIYMPDDVAEMIRGPEGSQVVVVVEREGQMIKFVMTREPLDVAPQGTGSPLPSPIKKLFPVTP